MQDAELHLLHDLIRNQRVAALGTLEAGAPYVSMVLYAPAEDFSAFFVHISRLAVHTRNLRADSRAGLMIAEPDNGEHDPQLLVRLSLQGTAEPLPPASPIYADACARYLARFPESAPLFQLPDFDLFRFTPREGRFVAGFGKAFNVTTGALTMAAGPRRF